MALALGRTLLALALVLAILWVLARLGRGRQSGRLRRATLGAGGRIEVLGRRSLGRHTSLAVVRVADRTLLVGQTPQQISVLTDIDDPDGADDPAREGGIGTDATNDVMPRLASGTGAGSPTAWDAFIDRVREMTVRH